MRSKELPTTRNILAALLATCTPAICIGAEDQERAFVDRSKCVVLAALDAISDTPMKTSQDQNRFLILDPLDHRQGYLQCVLYDWDKMIRCEAASGFYEHRPGEPRLHYVAGAQLAALARLGFSTDDSRGNYVREFAVKGPSDFSAIAEFALSAMFEAYPGPRLEIRVVAPYRREKDDRACAPIS
jgi:hypothetical protein